MVQPNKLYKIVILVFLPVFLYFKPIHIVSFNSVHLILFMVGGFTQFFVSIVQFPNKIVKSNALSIVVLILAIMSIGYSRTLSIEHIIIISLFFVFIAIGNDMFGIFSSKPSRMLGEISYSIYLLHGIVLYVLFTYLKVVNINNISLNTYMAMMPIVGSSVILISSVTFLQIEKPSINFGRRNILSSIPNRIMILAIKSFHRTR